MPWAAVGANEILDLFFLNEALELVGDASGLQPSSADGSLHLGLATGAPSGASDDQETNEADYTDYARVAVVRTSSGWTVSGNGVVTAAETQWPLAGSSGTTLTHWTLGTSSTGAGKLLAYGALDNSIPITSGVTQPTAAAGAIGVDLPTS